METFIVYLLIVIAPALVGVLKLASVLGAALVGVYSLTETETGQVVLGAGDAILKQGLEYIERQAQE